MVIQHPDFHRRVVNTNNIVMAKKAHLVPSLVSKYPGDYVDIDSLNNLIAEQPYIVQKTTIQNMYGRYSYGSVPFGSSVQIPADITIQSITVGEIQCTNGCVVICTTGCPVIVDIVVVWSNSGSSSSTFTPTVTIAGDTPITGTQITIAPGETGTTTFSSVSLPRGIPQLCFNTNMNG